MAISHTTLKSFRSPGILAGATAVQIGSYTMNRTFAKVLGLSICNTSAVAITATVYIRDANGVSHRLVYNVPLATGAAQIIAGPNDQYLVLQAGDSIYASIAGTNGTADLVMSVEERAE